MELLIEVLPRLAGALACIWLAATFGEGQLRYPIEFHEVRRGQKDGGLMVMAFDITMACVSCFMAAFLMLAACHVMAYGYLPLVFNFHN